MKYSDLIAELKEETKKEAFKKEASVKQNIEEDVNDVLGNLDLKIEEVETKTSQNIEKIAKVLDDGYNVVEIAKIAEEVGNSDIVNLVKIADTLSDVIADKAIEKIKQEI